MPDNQNNVKKVQLKLVGVNGNAFAVMGAFARQARREKWTQAEIDAVIKEATSSDYDHLLATIMNHCHDPFNGGDEDDDADEHDEDDDE